MSVEQLVLGAGGQGFVKVQGATLEERFEAFHAANPGVYSALARMVREELDAGLTRVSVKALFEVLRRDLRLRSGTEGWALNNSYTAFYARLLIERNPGWDRLIETRRRSGGL